MSREYRRSRKFFQLTKDRLAQAQLALRYWKEHDNLYIWAPIPIYTERTDYRCLELALIQEWQHARTNHSYVSSSIHGKASSKTCDEHQCPVWSCHPLASIQTQEHSAGRQRHLSLGTVSTPIGTLDYHSRSGPNTKARFEQTKMLRSNDGGLTLCYALRRLANNIQEPYRTLSLQAIDASTKWWQGKPAPRASALRAPWPLSPNLQHTLKSLKQFLRKWHLQVLAYQVPCLVPSFKTVFVKHAAALDQLCNHKQAISQWSTGTDAICCCQLWSKYKRAALNPSDPHWALVGSLLHDLLPADLAVVAEGSLLNKVCPSKKDYQANLKLGLHQWTKRNGLPSIPSQDIVDLAQLLWQQHTQEVTCHITKSSITTFQHLLEGTIFHCEDKEASSLRIYCPCLYYQAIENTFIDPSIFEPVNQEPSAIVDALVSQLTKQYGKSYPWATGKGRQLPAGYTLAKKKKALQSGRPIISFVDSPFRPMLNILARMIFQLIPVACPDHFATGDVCTLLSILRAALVDGNLILINQNSAGFFTSIAWSIYWGVAHASGFPASSHEG